MSSLRHLYRALLYYSGAVGFSLTIPGQTVTPQGTEFPLLEAAAIRGDQSAPGLSLTASGGYIAWQDNAIDGSGFGIAARYIDSTLSPGIFASFRVNQQAAGQQQRPQVAALPDGGAVFVWQGGTSGVQNIYARFLGSNRTFTTATDLRVNAFNGDHTAPAVAALSNGNVVVVWNSLNQDGSFQGVYGRLVRTNGQFLAEPFQINDFTVNNQRNPSVAVASNGNFVVVWSSEGQFARTNVDIVGKLYNGSGQPLTSEFQVNVGPSICATPSVSFLGTGGFTVAWAQRLGVDANGWDISARTFAADGSSSSSAFRVNSYTYGDQYWPRISSADRNQLVVWTSIGEDGSMEGVFGQLLSDGALSGQPFLINNTTINKQLDPAIGSDGSSRFLVVWSGFLGFANGFDLFGRRYVTGAPLPVPDAPFVSALGSSQLAVSWPPLGGYPISYYEIYMDGAVAPNATAAVTNGNYWVQRGLSAGTSHSFELAYVFAGGLRSALSAAGAGTTWGDDFTGKDGVPDGLPDDWQRMYWGSKSA